MEAVRRFRGDTHTQRFTVLDTNKNPIDITGWTFALTIDPDRSPTSADNNVGVFAGTIADGPNGVVDFDPTGVPAGDYWFDLQGTDTAGRIRTIAKDRWFVEQDITKEDSGFDSFDGGSASVQGNDVFNGGGA